MTDESFERAATALRDNPAGLVKLLIDYLEEEHLARKVLGKHSPAMDRALHTIKQGLWRRPLTGERT